MDESEVTAIRVSARRFRTAIERCPKEHLLITLRGFPAGACGDASILLGEFLSADGLGAFEYVAGSRYQPDFQSHAWLERKGLVVDITADQFPDMSESVTVTHDHRWHGLFREDQRHQARVAIYDHHAQQPLWSSLKAILVHLPGSTG
jgi:hypothetical protein